MNKRVIILSLDALQNDDLKEFLSLPYMSEVAKKASVVENVKEIYPTLTYPIHSTIITGQYPSVHGISHNQKNEILPEDYDWSLMGSNWYWYKSDIKVPTLVDKVFENGGTVSSICWPVTAGEKRGVNFPEIWPPKNEPEKAREVFEAASSKEAFERYYDKFVSHYKWDDNEDLVWYAPEIALDTLKRDNPNLLLCHIIHLDHIKHIYGIHSKERSYCLRQLDTIVNSFIETTKQLGIYEETNFVFLGDHGQIDVERIFNLNVLLEKEGIITTEKGVPTDYIAYSFSSGFSAQVFLKDSNNKEHMERVKSVLLKAKKDYSDYIDFVFDVNDAEQQGLKGEFSFVVEGTLGSFMGTDYVGDITIEKQSPDFKVYKATHGHHTLKGGKPPFIAFGPDIRENIVIENGSILQVCPTIAKILGIEMQTVENEFPILR